MKAEFDRGDPSSRSFCPNCGGAESSVGGAIKRHSTEDCISILADRIDRRQDEINALRRELNDVNQSYRGKDPFDPKIGN